MFYIVGLGNPGEKYEKTRHNVGFMVLDHMVKVLGLPKPFASSQYVGDISEGMIDGQEVTLLYPETFMNKSGSAVKKLVSKGEEKNLIVIYDDVDLAIGEIKVSFGRGAGGHNGVESIINSLGTKDFVRVRFGIAPRSFLGLGGAKRPTGEKLPKHVLGEFKKRELDDMYDGLETAAAAVQTIIQDGVEKAMNKFN